MVFFDAGIYRALRPKGPFDGSEELDGPGLETLLLQCLRAVNDGRHLGYEIAYWRTPTGHEVDFVLYGERGLHAVEVKRTRLPGRGDLGGLSAFAHDYPEAKLWLLHGGKETLYFGKIIAMPLEKFLREMVETIDGRS